LLEISHQNLWNKDSEHDIKIAYPPPKNKVIWWLYDDQFNAIRLLIPEFLAYLKGELGNNFF